MGVKEVTASMKSSKSNSSLTVVAYFDNWESVLAIQRVAGPAEHAGIRLIRGNAGEEISSEPISLADLVVIQRDFPRHSSAYEEIIARAHNEGKPVVYEIDDLLLELPKDHPDKLDHYYTNALFPMVQAIVEADAVTASTPQLCTYLRSFNPNTWLLPNYLNDRVWAFRNPPEDAGHFPVVVGYMGTYTHLPDLEWVVLPLKSILHRYGDKVVFRLWGGKPPADLSDYPNVEWTPLRLENYTEFATYFSKQECDLVIAPLRDNLFNRCKSPLKFLEYGALCLPGVFSRVVPYESIVDHGKNGFLASTLDEWEEYLVELIESSSLRHQVGIEAQRTVRKNWLLSQHAQEWKRVYQKILSAKGNQPEDNAATRVVRQMRRLHSESQLPLAEKVAALSSQAAEKEQALQALMGQLTEKERAVQTLHAQVVEKEQTVQVLETQVAEKEQTVQVLETQVAEKERSMRTLREQVVERDQALQALRARIAEKELAVEALQLQVAEQAKTVWELQGQLTTIFNSTGWGLLQLLWRVRLWTAPHGSLRERTLRLGMRGMRVLRHEGLGSFLRKGVRKISVLGARLLQRLFDWRRPALSASTPETALEQKTVDRSLQAEANVAAAEEPHAETSAHDITVSAAANAVLAWQDYDILSAKIVEAKRTRLANFIPKPPVLISLDESQLVAHAASLMFPSAQNPRVSIVIPVYNNVKFTLECLTSICKNTAGVSYEIIVIDDNSTDGTQDILSSVGNIMYLRNTERRGFILSCNAAAEKARGEFVLFLNNDVQVTESWLQPLVEMFAQYDDVGAVGPKILYPDGRLQEAGALINQDATTQLIGLFDDPGLPRYNYVRQVDYCSAVCLLMQTELFRELGGFDTRFAPAYYEDADLCLRLRRRGMHIFYNPQSVIVHHLSATSNSLDSDYKHTLVVANQQTLSERWQKEIDKLNQVRLIAFYLPQYHPIPENDRWWGRGFTDWIKVAKAQPNFVGHYQPHLASDLGFYDLRVDEIMEQQAELAKRYGIHGFCFYYYWFGGKRLLESPLERMLTSGKPNIPFCLCWANENWTRRWDGREDEVLIAQQHSDEDDRAVIRDLIRYMQHPNYIRINGKPLLLVYRVELFPDIGRTTHIWRETAQGEGMGEIYLAMVESFQRAGESMHPLAYGFDASVEFPPHGSSVYIDPPGKLLNPNYVGVVSDYREIVLKYLSKQLSGHVWFRTVMPGWDNTPRRQNDSYVFAYATPGSYQAWLEAVLDDVREQNFGEERIVFVNAWNEWAEGAHLEPDQHFGHGFLEATRNGLETYYLKGL